LDACDPSKIFGDSAVPLLCRVCRGGFAWTSHSLLGKPGNNPYCHYRALELEKQGVRERVVKIREAAPAAFAVGEFELIVERIADGAVVSTSTTQRQLVKLGENAAERWEPRESRVPPSLELCRACHSYIWPHETDCPPLRRQRTNGGGSLG